MVITEAELRQYWQNGRGQIPSFPTGTRFTPAALDFLKAQGLVPEPSIQPPPPMAGNSGMEQMELKSTSGSRLIITGLEVCDILAQGVKKVIVHPSVTLTDTAREKLRNAGVRLIPYTEKEPQPAPPVSQSTVRTSPAPTDQTALVQQIKKAVLARLNGSVDEAVLDAVLQKVLKSIDLTDH